MCKALELTEELFDITESIEREWKDLNNRLSIADQKRTDIEHFIENNNLNAAQGYNIYKLLKEVLEERRKIKNQINELRIIYNFTINIQKKRKSLIQSVEDKHNFHSSETESKKYKVRILTDLFGKVIEKQA